MIIFSTSRQIREWLKDKENSILDKHYTIGEFFKKIVVVDGKVLVDSVLRKKYLFEAIQKVEYHKLGLDGGKFINFFKDSNFIFSFFNELFLEKSSIDKALLSDTYVEYEEHLKILDEIEKNYKELLENDGYIDKFLIDEFRINKELLRGVDRIELRLDGYLSRFELEVLQKIEVPIDVIFSTDRFNIGLLKKVFDEIELKRDRKYLYELKSKELKELGKLKQNSNIEVNSFANRFDQVDFVFAKIDEFVRDGLDVNKIAVILPNESFGVYLKLFDEYENLNFAFGESFTQSSLFRDLSLIYECMVKGDELVCDEAKELIEEYEKSSDLLGFIRERASKRELEVIEEELFRLDKFKTLFAKEDEFFHFVLERLKEYSFDDAFSGAVTVMGVLESRGVEFDGVILVDFNEEFVPNVDENDMFLNSIIRKRANLPTKAQKENLQKHYYYSLLNSAKKVAISYVKNDTAMPSRFLFELGLEEKEKDVIYKDVAIKVSNQKALPDYSNEKIEIYEPISPTALQLLLECPKRYYFQYNLNIKNEDDSINFGTVLHEALKVTVENKKNLNNSQDYYEMIIEHIRNNEKIKDKRELVFEYLSTWQSRIWKFCEIDFDDMKRSNNRAEKTIYLEFEGKKLKARVDRIDESDDEIVLIDYKTSSNAIDKERFIYNFQTTFYNLFAKEQNKNFRVVLWDIKEGRKIDGIIKEDELKKVLNNLPQRVKEAEDITYQYIDSRGKLTDKTKKKSDICKYCDYKKACGVNS